MLFSIPWFINNNSNFIWFARFGLLPYRKPINVVVGSPIKVERITSPTNEDIDELHAKYVESLKKLYDDYNPIYGDKDVKLVIE